MDSIRPMERRALRRMMEPTRRVVDVAETRDSVSAYERSSHERADAFLRTRHASADLRSRAESGATFRDRSVHMAIAPHFLADDAESAPTTEAEY